MDEFLSLDEIIAAPDIEYRTAIVPEWKDKNGDPGKVRLGALDAGLYVEFSELEEKVPTGLWLLSKSLVDGEGNRIGTPEVVEKMKRKNKAVVNRLIAIILEMNDMKVVPKKDVRKNESGEAQPVASPIV